MPLEVTDTYHHWIKEDTVLAQGMKDDTITDSDGKEFVYFRPAYALIALDDHDNRVDQGLIHCISERDSISDINTDMEAEAVSLTKDPCPIIEKMRFANLGNKATIGAARTTRDFTGRTKVIVVKPGSRPVRRDELQSRRLTPLSFVSKLHKGNLIELRVILRLSSKPH